MLYRVYLYKPDTNRNLDVYSGWLGDALRENTRQKWNYDSSYRYMIEFPVSEVLPQVNKALQDPETGEKFGQASVRYPMDDQTLNPYIYIAISYENAEELLPRLHAIAAANMLVLHDGATNTCHYENVVNVGIIHIRQRVLVLQNAIMAFMKPVWRMRRLPFRSEDHCQERIYVITLRKDRRKSFSERVEEFSQCLKDHLSEGETLLCRDRSFVIKGKLYQITYILEGYKKHADRIGYMESGEAKTVLMRRISTDEAFRWMKSCTRGEIGDIWERMNFREMVCAYPNMADRFAASVNITKWQRKQPFRIRYSGIGYYGSEILFHVLPDDSRFYYDVSVLKIEECSAEFILPFVEDVYDEIYERYYEENHLSPGMWRKIMLQLKWAKNLILHDILNEELQPYLARFDKNFFCDDFKRPAGNYTASQIFYAHRHEIAGLYDAFIRWSEAQFRCYSTTCSDLIFNIQGP